jgi:hypothetical protein
VCKQTLDSDDKTCPNWKKHPSGFKFTGDVLPWERNKPNVSRPSESRFTGFKRKGTESTSKPSTPAKKHLQIANQPANEEGNDEIKAVRAAINQQRKLLSKLKKANKAGEEA